MPAIVIINYRTPSMAIDAVLSCCQAGANDAPVYLVDGASPDDSAAILRERFDEDRRVTLMLLEKNGGFAYANNQAIRRILECSASVQYILLLNPDTISQPGAVQALLDFMDQHPDVGLAGSRLENPDGSTQFAARRFHGLANEFESAISFGPVSRLLKRWNIAEAESDSPHPTDWVPGASLMIRRQVFEAIGLLDDGYFMYFEEVDFCLRAQRAGFSCWYVPQSRVTHFVGQSSGVTCAKPGRLPKYWFESRARYYLKNHGRLYKLACDIAWTVGRGLCLIRYRVAGRENPFPPHHWRDFVRFNFGCSRAWTLKSS